MPAARSPWSASFLASEFVSSSHASFDPKKNEWLDRPVRLRIRSSRPAARHSSTTGSLCCDIHMMPGYTICPVDFCQVNALSRMFVRPSATAVPPDCATHPNAARTARMVTCASRSGSTSTQPGCGKDRETGSEWHTWCRPVSTSKARLRTEVVPQSAAMT